MNLDDLKRRVAALEKVVEQLREQVAKAPPPGPWWVTEAGRFANDPVFDEIVRLGRQYRESLHPDHGKKKPRKKKHAHS